MAARPARARRGARQIGEDGIALIPCAGLDGTVRLIEQAPMLAPWRDVLYVPTGRSDGQRGLFDQGRKLVTAAGTFRAAPDPVPLEPRHTRLDPDRFPYAPDDARYLFLGTLTGHYGHFLLSSLARLWALDRVERRGLKIVILNHGPIATILAIEWLRDLLAAAGVAADDLVSFARPVRFREILVPSPAIEEQHFIHRTFAAFGNRIGAVLADRVPAAPSDRPLFLSKARLTGGVTRFVNEDALCARLAAAGVEIVHPEQLPIAQQIRLFHDRPRLMGLAGSALHTAILAPGRRLVSLNAVGWQLSNQPLLDRANGGETLCLYPEGDIVREADAPGFDAHYRFRDPARTADELLAALAG